ncbi:MAG TPA: hypothetical protein VNY52_00615 [Solirubrobacteraceae bacterium]|jgi:hypothetical protein|nr:hypothetical protein [Solirubrobacteraceae bacterium]
MSEPAPFTRVGGTTLYWQPESQRTIGFQASNPALPDILSPAESWADTGGLYLFIGGAGPATKPDAQLAAELLAYLGTQRWPHGPRFLWLASASEPYARWRGRTVWLQAAGGGWRVSRRADFDLRGYTLTLAPSSTVTLAGWEFAFAPTGSGAPAATFSAPGGEYPAAGGGVLRLALAGASGGCLRLELELAGGGATPSDFQRLGVGVRYFLPEPERPAAIAGVSRDAHGGVFVRPLELAALVQPSAGRLTLDALLDPVRPLVPDRTHLAFFLAGAPPPPALGSTFATARGYGVALTPQPGALGVPDARLVLAEQPLFAGADTHVPKQRYLTPQGAFAITWQSGGAPGGSRAGGEQGGAERERPIPSTDSSIYQLLCGASGLEYLGMPTATASRLVFVPGRPAYASLTPADSPAQPALDATGTTAWVYATTATGAGVRYYAQPADAPLYQASGDGFLEYMELAAALLPGAEAPRPFPLAPYHGLGAEDVPAALQLEARAIAPTRRQALLPAPTQGAMASAGGPPTTTARTAVTPQGLGVGIAADGTWTWLGIANNLPTATAEPDLRFTTIDGPFRQALETNRLFLVMANAAEFAKHGSVAYQLTADGLVALRGTVPDKVLDAVKAKFAPAWKTYATETEFLTALHEATPEADAYARFFEREAGLLTPTLDGWRVRISPRNWAGPPGAHTIVVFKLAGGLSLRAFTDDVTLWGWPAVAALPEGTAATQARLRALYRDAEEAYARTSGGGRESPYADFVRLLDDPRWTGILAFDCEVPLPTLPAPLQALGAGIDPTRFRAHHIGFNMTPFTTVAGQLTFERTSIFGLIDYEDTADQYLESAATSFYAFKVLRLTVAFRNSAVSGFASQVELLVNRLFGATTRLYPTEHGNNILLDGVYQKQPRPGGGEEGTYVFTAAGERDFQLEDSALRRVVLHSTQLVTVTTATPSDRTAKTRARFVLGGDLHFFEPPAFDPFGFGVDPPGAPHAADPPPGPTESFLRFGNLALDMEFSVAAPQPKFTLRTEALSLDFPASHARPKSLLAGFPLRLAGFLATTDPRQANPAAPEATATRQRPESLGYVSVGSPLQQSQLVDPWFGIEYLIDLGTLGALAGSSPLTLRLLVAWSAGGTREAPALYLGVRLPGVKDALGIALPLQGAITLGFHSIQFLVNDTGPARREHILRFRNFALRLLGIALPPGNNDIYLFANPNQAASTKLGWYAAYAATEDPKAKQRQGPATRLAAARREPS